jgi:hypothetical protein
VAILAIAPTMAGIARANHPYDLDRPMIGLPVSLPCADGVKDPIFSILVGLVEADIYGTLTQDRLGMQLDRMGKTSHLPYRSVREVTRLPRGDGRPTAEVSVTFDGPLSLPIPYSILGYNPGSFRAAERCVFREWDLGTVTLQHSRKRGDEIEMVQIVLENAHLYGLGTARSRSTSTAGSTGCSEGISTTPTSLDCCFAVTKESGSGWRWDTTNASAAALARSISGPTRSCSPRRMRSRRWAEP